MIGQKARDPALILTLALLVSGQALAGGDKNAYNNPTGDPPDDTYQTPYSNTGDGRMLVFCAEDETLVVTRIDPGSVEAACLPTGD